MKSNDVEILVSNKVANKELLGVFQNSLHLSNYENNHKREKVAEKEKEKDPDAEEFEEEKDPRIDRVKQKIENI